MNGSPMKLSEDAVLLKNMIEYEAKEKHRKTIEKSNNLLSTANSEFLRNQRRVLIHEEYERVRI